MYRILIVDNEPIIVDGLYHLFLEVGHLELDVHRAYSSAQALKLLEKHKIDIAFLDIHMPGMNGLDLQKKMQERWRKCKVIFLTGFNDFSYAQSALRHGVVDGRRRENIGVAGQSRRTARSRVDRSSANRAG